MIFRLLPPNQHPRTLLMAAAMLVCVLPAPAVADATVQTSIGVDYSSGKYGETVDTDMLYVPLSVKYSHFPWTLKATLPYLRISGPATAVGGIDGIEFTDAALTPSASNRIGREFGPGLDLNNDSSVTRTVSGIGDVLLSASWAMDTLWNTAPFADLVAKVKLPTADEDKGLGTGELDAQLQLDLASTHGRYTPLLTLGYKWPGYSSFQNQRSASLGLDVSINEPTRIGFVFDYRDAATASSAPRREWMLYHNHRLSPRYSIMSYVVFGASDNSPDQGLGMQLSIRH